MAHIYSNLERRILHMFPSGANYISSDTFIILNIENL